MTQEQAMIEYWERKFALLNERLDRIELRQQGINPEIHFWNMAMNKNKQGVGQ